MREHSGTSGIATSTPGITRGRKGWGSYGSKGSLAKALRWADPRTPKNKRKKFSQGSKEAISELAEQQRTGEESKLIRASLSF